MKRNIIFGAMLAVLTLVSCTQKLEYKRVAFAAFDNKSFSVKEDAGTVTVDLTAYNIESASNVTVSFGGTAKAGENYTVSGIEGGVLNFTESGTKTLTFNIVDKPGVYLGNLSIVLEIEGVSEGLEIGALKGLTITILDNDIPVNWDFVLGKWSASDYGGEPYDVTITKKDENTILLENLWDGGQIVEGTITFDAATNSAQIVFAAYQVVYNHSTYGPIGMFGITEDGSLDKANNYNVFATVTSGGISIGPWIALILTGTYAYYSFDDGGVTELTK